MTRHVEIREKTRGTIVLVANTIMEKRLDRRFAVIAMDFNVSGLCVVVFQAKHAKSHYLIDGEL